MMMEQQFSLAFVLYKDKNVMISEIIRNYQKLWGESLVGNVSVDGLRGTIAQFSYVISFVDEPINREEILRVAKHNPFFEQGETIANGHQCHAIVGVKGVSNAVARYKVLTQLAAAMCSAYNASALYLGKQQLLLTRQQVLAQAEILKQGQLPVQAWIYYGFYSHNEAFWAYTQGLSDFGRKELEICSDVHTLQEMHEVLIAISALMISNHHTFEEGELLEAGDWCVSCHYRKSPTLQQPTLLLRFEND